MIFRIFILMDQTHGCISHLLEKKEELQALFLQILPARYDEPACIGLPGV
jgi:hypothetical protein